PWFDRHVFVAYAATGAFDLALMRLVRGALGGAALLMAVVGRPALGRWAARRSAGALAAACARVAVAATLALVCAEGLLHLLPPPEPHRLEDRIGRPHARYGWEFVPLRAHVIPFGEPPRRVRFETDRFGNRAPGVAHVADPDRPTVLFAGESITCGHGL